MVVLLCVIIGLSPKAYRYCSLCYTMPIVISSKVYGWLAQITDWISITDIFPDEPKRYAVIFENTFSSQFKSCSQNTIPQSFICKKCCNVIVSGGWWHQWWMKTVDTCSSTQLGCYRPDDNAARYCLPFVTLLQSICFTLHLSTMSATTSPLHYIYIHYSFVFYPVCHRTLFTSHACQGDVLS